MTGRCRSNLTLNLGLRWEDFVPPTETKGNISNVVLGPGQDVLTGLSIKKGGSLYKNTYTNFEPQLGFAWSPTTAAFGHKFVVRGGFGVGYNLEQFANTSNGRFNPPFETNLTLYDGNMSTLRVPTNTIYPASRRIRLLFKPLAPTGSRPRVPDLI